MPTKVGHLKCREKHFRQEQKSRKQKTTGKETNKKIIIIITNNNFEHIVITSYIST